MSGPLQPPTCVPPPPFSCEIGQRSMRMKAWQLLYFIHIFFTFAALAQFSARCFLSGEVALSEWSHHKWKKQTSCNGGVNERVWTIRLWNSWIKYTRLGLVEQWCNQRWLTAGPESSPELFQCWCFSKTAGRTLLQCLMFSPCFENYEHSTMNHWL